LTSLRIADFGRSYNENSSGNPDSPSRTEAAVQWFAQHVDLNEKKPPSRTFGSTTHDAILKICLDLYQFQDEVKRIAGTIQDESTGQVS
jgi:hypothetical protein